MRKIKVGDTVIVRSGKDRTKIGQVEVIIAGRALVNGINIVKKHQKKTAATPQGGIIEKSLPVHVSKLMLIDAKLKKPTRVRFQIDAGKKERRYTKSQELVTVKTTTK
ncbi:MAG: 50S ribosomal protein L24 [bacterium]|nr:50S ribosomal protein L24 [bacterium]